VINVKKNYMYTCSFFLHLSQYYEDFYSLLGVSSVAIVVLHRNPRLRSAANGCDVLSKAADNKKFAFSGQMVWNSLPFALYVTSGYR